MFPKSKRLVFALCLMLGVAQAGRAAVITFLGQEIPIPTTFAGVSVDLETGVVTNDLAGVPGADANFFLGGMAITNDADQTSAAPSWQPVRTGTNVTDPIDNLSIGTLVGPTLLTATGFGGSGGATSHFPPFTSGSSGYIGFSLEIAGPTTVYGWMRVTLQDDNTPGVIHEWAYDDSGDPLAVGTIPEPSHSFLVLIGLATLALRRRR